MFRHSAGFGVIAAIIVMADLQVDLITALAFGACIEVALYWLRHATKEA